jgi:hypothetical protein
VTTLSETIARTLLPDKLWEDAIVEDLAEFRKAG